MRGYQQDVIEIRRLVRADDDVVTPEIRELARRYAHACCECNERLRWCEELLKKDLRDDALQLAAEDPPVLELVDALNFPERADWDEITQARELPRPPDLLWSAADALKEAHTRTQTLETLWRQHRRLALARAPLPDRLEVMRRIGVAVSRDPAWEEDIIRFEKSRIGQLEADANEAVKQGRMEWLEDLLKEVRTTPWKAGPPLELLAFIEEFANRQQAKKNRRTLEELARDLHLALAASDTARAQELYDRWNHEAARAELSPSDPLHDDVRVASNWLADQSRKADEEAHRRSSLASLQIALESGTPRAELQRLYRDVLSLDPGGVPEPIEQRYRARIQALEHTNRRRAKIIFCAGLVGAALFGGLLWFWIEHSIRANRVAEVLQTVKRMRDNWQILAAEAYLETLASTDPEAAGVPVIRELTSRVTGEAKVERQRIEQFQASLHEAEADRPSEDVAHALMRAEALARSPEEKAEVRRMRIAQTRRGRLQQKNNGTKPRAARIDRALWFSDSVAAPASGPNWLPSERPK
jgi:hypothetical protein